MEFEFYRNNARYTASIEHPLVFTGETKIEKGGGSLSPIAVFENKVYAASGTYLVCFDLNTKAVIWERESGTEISTPIDGGNNMQFPPHRHAVIVNVAEVGNGNVFPLNPGVL